MSLKSELSKEEAKKSMFDFETVLQDIIESEKDFDKLLKEKK